ncbi:Hsp70 family protein [Luteimonas yindakuii]|uniref:Hsp70 family protein n=1 Tax=Luteimonas yindakuii TaxID=2565782 RepID=UPI001422349C|nr:Hsp70 family protein [Luteimonas yindakuii]
MRIGVDFGTSYSAAGAMVDGRVELVRFGDEPQFRTAAFFPRYLPNADCFELTPELERHVEAHVRTSLNDQARSREQINQASTSGEPFRRSVVERSMDEIRKEAEATVRRDWLAQRASMETKLNLDAAVFGEEAIEAYISEHGGRLVQSPKSLLGFRLHGDAHSVLLGITTRILAHIRTQACAQFGSPATSVLLGRPVRFRSSMGEGGNQQAVRLLTNAATAAGFEQVDFLEEPVAAAWAFHETSSDKHLALIVDVGGGTSDISLADVGGDDTAPKIHKSWGSPVGGTDVDLHLNLQEFMPLFGKGVTRTPVHHFYNAAAVHDQHRQRDFIKASFSGLEEPYRHRVGRLQASGATVRLNRAVERTKIFLSDSESASLRLSYIEQGLQAEIDQGRLLNAASELLRPLRTLLSSARTEIDEEPQRIYVTGGMSRAPYVATAVSAVFPDTPLISREESLAVIEGLVRASTRLL